MNCTTFSKAFQDNMNSLGLPAPNSLFSSLMMALGNLSAMLNAFKSVGPTATVAEIVGATTLREKLNVVGVMAASYYVGAVIGSLIVATEGVKACSDPYTNSSAARYRAVAKWIANRGLIVPMDMQVFMQVFIQNHPEVILDTPQRKSYAMRARQHGANP